MLVPSLTRDRIMMNISAMNTVVCATKTIRWETQTQQQLTDANIESSCGISITDGTFEALNIFTSSPQSYASTTSQSIAFETVTTSYFLKIDSSSGITKTVTNLVSAPTAPTNLIATVGDAQVSVAFTAPSNDGG